MTNEQWEAAEQNLQSSYRIVKLQADGYTLSLQTQRYKMQLCIAVYVDGKIQGKWLTEDCEIRRKFFQKHKHSILTRKEQEKLKRDRKAFREAVLSNSVYYTYSPYWSSFRSLKRHLCQNCTDITLYEEAEA